MWRSTGGSVCDGAEATCTIGGETRGKAHTVTAESFAAPIPGASGMGNSADALTAGTTSDTGSRGFKGDILPLLIGLPLPSPPAKVARVETPASSPTASPQVQGHGGEERGGWHNHRGHQLIPAAKNLRTWQP